MRVRCLGGREVCWWKGGGRGEVGGDAEGVGDVGMRWGEWGAWGGVCTGGRIESGGV